MIMMEDYNGKGDIGTMMELPLSTLLAFVALLLTVLAAIIWAIFAGKEKKSDTTEDDV